MWQVQQQSPILRRRIQDHLPDYIILHILPKLPVKSLLRFRCVCKPWSYSITNLNLSCNHNDHDHGHGYRIRMHSVLIGYGIGSSSHSKDCTISCDYTLNSISQLGISTDFPFRISKIIGSCNGLLCLIDYQSLRNTTSDVFIYLWNPSIRKFKRLSDTCLTQLNNVAFGFAYHLENNDYKVVRTSSSYFERPRLD